MSSEKVVAEQNAKIRKLIGQGIIEGLLNPGSLGGLGPLASYAQGGNYNQEGGPYTQSGGGEHRQSGSGGYTQSKVL